MAYIQFMVGVIRSISIILHSLNTLLMPNTTRSTCLPEEGRGKTSRTYFIHPTIFNIVCFFSVTFCIFANGAVSFKKHPLNSASRNIQLVFAFSATVCDIAFHAMRVMQRLLTQIDFGKGFGGET